MKSGTAVLCLLLVLATAGGCVRGRVSLDEAGAPEARTEIVASMGNDAHGLPVPGALLLKRPSRPGDHFTVLRLAGDRPVLGCDVVVEGRNPDFVKPLKAVYEWTGEGFKLGAGISGALLNGMGCSNIHDSDAATVELAFVVAPLAAGTVGGFVVGVADGIKTTVEELGKAVTTDEQAVTCSTYEYDGRGRLRLIRMYTPDRSRELVRTEFEYEGNGTVPSRTVVRSLVEGTERDVR